jgi:hypothetical protein
MIPVNDHNVDLYGIEEFTILLKIHRNDIIATLRCQTYCHLAVSTVNGYSIIGILEADNLVTRQRTAIFATAELQFALFVKETVYV